MAKRAGIPAEAEKFCQLVARGEDKIAAFRQAWPKRVRNSNADHVRAHETAKKYEARISELAQTSREIARKEYAMDAAAWLRGVVNLATYDVADLFDKAGCVRPVHEMPQEIRQAIVGMEMNDDGRPKKIRMAPKSQAWEMLGRHLGTFKADNQQKNELLTNLIEFINARAKLPVVHDINEVPEPVVIKTHEAALIPRG